MSLDDLWHDDRILYLFFLVTSIVFIIAFFVARKQKEKVEAISKKIYGEYEYTVTKEEKNSKIVSLYDVAHPLSPTITINMVLFELENGNRVQLAIKDSNEYFAMVVGDCGTLKHCGKKFVSFERSV